MSIKLVTAPTVEPVSVADVEGQCNADFSDQYQTVAGYITAVRQRAELELTRTLITTTFDLVLDGFPCATTRNPFAAVEIPLPPLQSVVSVKYLSPDGVLTTQDDADYVVDTDSVPGRILPAYGKTWPSTLDYPGAVRVQFEAGYGDTPEDVPQCIRNWMLLNIGALVENREVITVGSGGVIDLTTMADSLLDPERWNVRV